MPSRFSLFAFLSLAAIAPAAAPLAAQQGRRTDSTDVESDERPPRLAAGLTLGTLHRDGGVANESMIAIVQLQPRPWLSFSVAPGLGRMTYDGTAGVGGATRAVSYSANGLTDIPITAGAAHGFDALGWSPSVAVGLTQSLATGASKNGLGVGHGTTALDETLSAAPVEGLEISVGSWQPLSRASGTGAVDLEGALSLGRATATLGYSTEIGAADSGSVLARAVVAGVAYSLAGPLTLTIDAGHGLTSGAPRWNFEVGFGTAFAGLSPLNATSPLRRMKKAFGASSGSSSGYRKKP